MLVDLMSTPLVVLEVFLVFGVDRVQLADSARLRKQRRVEKPGEAFESAS